MASIAPLLLVAKSLILTMLLIILGAKGAEDYKDSIDYQIVADQLEFYHGAALAAIYADGEGSIQVHVA